MIKNLPANAEDIRDRGSIPGSGRSPGEGHGNTLQYCLENHMDRGTWWAVVHRVTKSQTQLSAAQHSTAQHMATTNMAFGPSKCEEND